MSALPEHGPQLTSATPAWAADVLRFWFEEVQPEQWFERDAELDNRIRARFLALHEQTAAMPLDELTTSAKAALAAVIVLDQFSRNMFRGSARAFAADAKALAIAEAAVAKGYAAAFGKNERQFLYLPFEHSEDLATQTRCVELMAELADEELTRYAVLHRDIVARFGRFPHRNAALGRVSTEEEIAFLQQPDSAF